MLLVVIHNLQIIVRQKYFNSWTPSNFLCEVENAIALFFNSKNIDKVVYLRDVMCALRDSVTEVLNEIDSHLGGADSYGNDPLSMGLPKLVESISLTLSGVMYTLEQGAVRSARVKHGYV